MDIATRSYEIWHISVLAGVVAEAGQPFDGEVFHTN